MIDADVRSFAALVCLYSLFEFFIRRVWLSSASMRERNAKRAGARALVLYLVMIVGSSAFLSFGLAAALAVVAGLYLLYELTAAGEASGNPERALERFLVKQLVFGLLLYAAWKFARPAGDYEWRVDLGSLVLSGPGGAPFQLSDTISLVLSIATAYFFVVDGGTRIVRGVFNKFPGLYGAVVTKLDRRYGGETEENVGEWIGVLERLIALTFVLVGSYAALGFAIAAKSIARFKELEDKQFAEYYILGTSVSLLVALFAGLAIRVLFGF